MGEPEDDQLNDEPLGFLLGAAARKVAKLYAAGLSSAPVTPSQLYALRQLWREDGLALVDLRERAQLDATSATWIADQLEKAGLVERRRNDPDRRIVRLWLTDAGRALQGELEPRVARLDAAVEARLGERFTPADLAVFRAVLGTLIGSLPEGDDLWAAISASWDEALDDLRRAVEKDAAVEPEGTSRS